MYEAVAIRARHLIVDLRDHVARQAGGGQSRVDANAEATETVRVGRGKLDKSDIERHGAAFEEVFDLAEIDRRVVGAAFVDGIAYIASDEHGIVAEVPFHLGRDVRRL